MLSSKSDILKINKQNNQADNFDSYRVRATLRCMHEDSMRSNFVQQWFDLSLTAYWSINKKAQN